MNLFHSSGLKPKQMDGVLAEKLREAAERPSLDTDSAVSEEDILPFVFFKRVLIPSASVPATVGRF